MTHLRKMMLAYLFRERKLGAATVTQRLAALRFFFIQTMKKPWSVADTPYPKKTRHLPSILSPELAAPRHPQVPGAAEWCAGRPSVAPSTPISTLSHRLISFADGQVFEEYCEPKSAGSINLR